MRPLIGIPPCLDTGGRWRRGRSYQYADHATAAAVARAGGLPVYLALQDDPEALAARLDGLLLPGGDDLAPDRAYPAEVHFELAPAAQVDFDRGVLGAALAQGLPVLAICYGMQLLALHHGGGLHYDIETDLPAAGPHRLATGDASHALRLEPASQLAALLGDAGTEVNSRHHQAVASPGDALRVAARARDGVIEAIERPGPGFCIGVQWHPEALEGPHPERLFSAFVAACLAGPRTR